MINKKASEKINAVMFVMYLFIIGGGVVVLVTSYVGSPIDVRGLEIDSLYNDLMNCMVKNGFLEPAVLSSDFDIFKECKLDGGKINSTGLFFEFHFLDDSGKEVRSLIRGGDIEEILLMKNNCDVYLGTLSQKEKWCFMRNETYYSYEDSLKKITISGWVATKKNGWRNERKTNK